MRGLLRSPAALILLAGLTCGPACGHHRAETRHMPAWVFRASRTERGGRLARIAAPPASVHPRPRGGLRGTSEAADLVTAALQGSGHRFGTDGSVAALWGYLRSSHGTIPPSQARRGDVVFFDLAAAPAAAAAPWSERCEPPDHVGIVTEVDRDGRIAFVDARAGRVRTSYVDPLDPRRRRDASGRIHNSFLRPMRRGDPVDRPLFAGEMLCSVARPRPGS